MGGWVVFYSDGVSVWTFSSEDGSWVDAPDEDVQLVVEYHDPPYKTLTEGHDTYTMEGEPGVKHGRLISDIDYYLIQQLALDSEAP